MLSSATNSAIFLRKMIDSTPEFKEGFTFNQIVKYLISAISIVYNFTQPSGRRSSRKRNNYAVLLKQRQMRVTKKLIKKSRPIS